MAQKAGNSTIFTTKRIHYFSGITLSVFIGIHLLNHLASLWGVEVHLQWMEHMRKLYRNPIIESILLAAVLFQIVTGLKLLFRKTKKSLVEKVQVYSGLYLSFFLVVHVSAIIYGRMIALDTNFYYAAAGLNHSPASLYFIPYYFFSVVAVSLHVAAIHFIKTQALWGAALIALLGSVASVLIILGFTHPEFNSIPLQYQEFILKFSGGK